MGRSHESIGVQNLLFVEGELIRRRIPIKDVGNFSQNDSRYQVATRPGYDDNSIGRVLKPFLSKEEIPRGIEDIKEIRCDYFTRQNKHNKKHHH